MSAALQDYFRSPRGILAAWSGWICGPGAWGLHLGASYLLVEPACDSLGVWVLYAAALASMALALAGIGLAWRTWNRLGRGWPRAAGGVIGRSRFLALSGLVLSAYFLLLVIAQAIPMLLISPCT